MLLELRIENLLLIERAELRLEPGLNAITGETGAGKTMLARSLDLLCGGRSQAQAVRPGAPEAYVEGVFQVPDGFFDDPELADLAGRLPPDAGEVVLARRVGTSGRTSAYVQGRSATVDDLKALGGRLLAFTGQHEQRRLTLASHQLDLLDAAAGEAHFALREDHRRAHAEVLSLERELSELRDRIGARERDLDLLRFELGEIEEVAPDPDEVVDLAAERETLRHAERLRFAAATAAAALSGDDSGDAGATPAAALAESSLRDAAGVNRELDGLLDRVSSLAIELADASSELHAFASGVEADPARLEELESRLDRLDRLERKHGGSLQAVLAHADRCRSEIERLEGAEERTAELEQRLEEALGRRAQLAGRLREGRRAAATSLSGGVEAELGRLAMEGARLEVSFEDRDAHGPLGDERVELLVAANPGTAPAPVRDAASGGELSRIMLALVGAGAVSGGPVLVFDEIDAGVGGTTARAVGERLKALSERRQVVCITHLPQVASLADAHFRIAKEVAEDDSRTSVERVEGEDLVAEITRMLGEGGEAARRHARELLAA